jgi:hypothetical protein
MIESAIELFWPATPKIARILNDMKLHLENDCLTIELEWYDQLWAVTLKRMPYYRQ